MGIRYELTGITQAFFIDLLQVVFPHVIENQIDASNISFLSTLNSPYLRKFIYTHYSPKFIILEVPTLRFRISVYHGALFILQKNFPHMLLLGSYKYAIKLRKKKSKNFKNKLNNPTRLFENPNKFFE